MMQLALPLPRYPSPCGHSIHIDRRAGDFQHDGHCEQCDTLVSYRLDRGEWAIYWRRTYRPDEVTPLNMPKRYRKLWGDWIKDTLL